MRLYQLKINFNNTLCKKSSIRLVGLASLILLVTIMGPPLLKKKLGFLGQIIFFLNKQV